jgi:hypothetical protein
MAVRFASACLRVGAATVDPPNPGRGGPAQGASRMTFDEFFRRATGFAPYGYQVRFAEAEVMPADGCDRRSRSPTTRASEPPR